jgi:hypothetical protein
MRWLLFQLRWWRWFLSAPSVIHWRHVKGLDKESFRVIQRRWEEREPKG